jgi:hypothetical protein
MLSSYAEKQQTLAQILVFKMEELADVDPSKEVSCVSKGRKWKWESYWQIVCWYKSSISISGRR